MIRDGPLLAVKRDGVRMVPAELVANSTVLKHLPASYASARRWV